MSCDGAVDAIVSPLAGASCFAGVPVPHPATTTMMQIQRIITLMQLGQISTITRPGRLVRS